MDNMDNMDNNFKKFVDSLKGNSTSTHLDLDATWDIPNLLLNSNELLLIVLTKTTMIPFIEDYTKINNDLDLTEEQASSIQESNEMLLTLHNLIQKYCIQQFVLGSIMKREMDNIILSCPEIEDVQSIDDLMNYIANFKEIQSQNGGLNITTSFLTLIGKLILFTFLITSLTKSESDFITFKKISDNKNQLVLNGNNLIQTFNPEIVDVSLEDFSQSLQEKSYIKTKRPTSVNNMMVKYDKDIEKQKTQVVNQFLSFFSTPQSGIELLNDIIDKFNSDSTVFSQGAEGICLELMDKANEKGVFSNFMDFDTQAETEQKIEDAEMAVKKQNSEAKEQTINNALAPVVASVATFAFTGDYAEALNQAAPYIASLGSSLYDSLINTKNIEEQKKEIIAKSQPTSTALTPSQKIELENKIYHFSKVYCSYGYNLQLQLDENGSNIDVIGDKIEYNWILNVITLLENNIDFKIKKASIIVDNTFELNALVSLKQRVQVLKAITNKLYHIVNFSMQAQISKLNNAPTAESLKNMELYFNNQLKDLLDMLESAKKEFPKREQELKQETILFESEKKLNEMDDALKLQKTEADIASQQRENERNQLISEMKAQNVSASWIATKTIFQSYIDLAANATLFTGESAGDLVEALGKAGLKVPLGAVNSILDFINNVLWSLVTNPSGWLLLGSGLIVLTFWLGGIIGVIRIFKKSGEIFVTIIYGSIMFVYKLIKTPFGWIYRRQDVIVAVPLYPAYASFIPPLQAEQDVRTSEPDNDDINAAAQSLLSLGRGGKLRTRKQRNKNKVKKTKGKRKNKNKNKTKRRKKSNKYSKRRK
jgi:hypothetical protein